MPSVVAFNGKSIIEPGAYSRVLGGETNPPDLASFGKVLIIDTGSLGNYGYGSGILGERESGPNSIYTFNNLNDFRQAVGGSVIWDASKWLFKPSKNPGFRGVESIVLVSAKESTKGVMTFTWDDGANGGVFSVATKVEGTAANGIENVTSGLIERGFGMRMKAGTIDPAKFVVEFYRGTFRGLDFNNVPFDNIKAEDAVPELIVRSKEFSTVGELVAWCNGNRAFNSWFYINSTTAVTGTGALTPGDLTTYDGDNVLATGGTQTYTTAALNEVFKYITELDYTFILADKYEADMSHANNVSIFEHIKNESEYQRFLVIGGGADSDDYQDTLDAAEDFDSSYVHVVYSRTKKNDPASVLGYREYPTIYHAAAYLGRIAGQEPQVPATFKELDFDGVKHELAKSEREQALLQGVVHMRYVQDLGWVINQDVNTKQTNELDIYEDGTSPHGSIMRIAALLNKELVVNIRKKFVGGNANTSSPADVKAFVETYLNTKVASRTDDNLILSFKNVRVQLLGSDTKVDYGFMPNGPTNRFFITGFMYNVSLAQ